MRCMEWLFYVVALGLQALDESDSVNHGAAGLPQGGSGAARPSTNRLSLQLTHTRVEAIFPKCTAYDFLFSNRHSLVLRLFP
jgi:hypothetical protein